MLNVSDLADEFGEQLYRLCRKLSYSKEDAEDLFQETFLRVFEQQAKVNASGNAKGFLFSAAIFLYKGRKRKYARRNRIALMQPPDETLASTAITEDEFIAREDIRIVRELVNALPEKYKIPTVLYYSAEMGLADIAAILKLPTGTVKSRLHKARKMIEKGLVKNGFK